MQLWLNLMDVLGKINLSYENAVKLGNRKRDALVTINMDELSKILDEENLLTAKIQKLERQRGEILTNIAKTEPSININTKPEELFSFAPTSAVADRLKSLHKALSKQVDLAIKIRDNNQVLAQGALTAVRVQLNKLGGASVDPTYGSSGATVSYKKKFDFNA